MAILSRIKKGPHDTPRPSGEPSSYTFDEASFLGSFEQLPDNIKSRVLLGIAGVAIVVAGSVAGMQAYGDRQRENIPTNVSPSEQPAGNPSEPETYNPSGIPTSGNESQ